MPKRVPARTLPARLPTEEDGEVTPQRALPMALGLTQPHFIRGDTR